MSIGIRNISKHFGAFHALDDVSIDIPSGQLVGLLGPSGCGKTTLLRIIAGLERADAGRILLEGDDASDRHVRDRQVGFVFQHYALFRHMTVFDNVAFGLRVKPRRQRPSENEIKKRVSRLLDLVQLGWLADRYPSQLSGGQRQRIALARALAVEPKVLLLDEPFGALDAKVRKELRRWLRRLHDEIHVTSVFVTHDQEEALEVSDRVVLMNKGRVEQTGVPDQVYDHPATPFVASFLGSVNLFHGRVEAGQLHVGDHALPVATVQQDNSRALGFVRPHEFDVLPASAPGNGLPARIQRVVAIGPLAQVELTRQDGQLLEVSVLRDTLDVLGLREGDHVSLRPRNIRVFADEQPLAA
ncbi:MAG TPA: sulfate ABC transporter ATP-binding protein [Accumulibacter sp.]|uniref:sulfate/molybdate ABC transporter ATP-binding protein n=1 Tax=Accumulibacter sp. TaxID=2053492 RepID=UPI002879D019|nr:sulfate ABC transporter ATP-binding protein [Accumulibacter sp.]MDS4012889.1 sulfate ABC transporter ATP-binding protein [Accumulibacter sp.]MDS4054054.1 sulfate ABC transporter ATP-binding protein [Accumulibacter sp.]HMV05328.1 sulfate ABC transporter ATP-binding protein [Accumulibacter sp.]HMW62294.1 sulfate ABC transporter ATP-binding protein [Accumulibacter sp.]HMW79356.1 sulfate ABC transporter ATP-binding protein [Accumulibacter sp.]